MLGGGRGREPAHDLRSSSRARLSISNCLSCSRTEASREAVLAHCSIHTLGVEGTGQDRTGQAESAPQNLHRHRDPLQGQNRRGRAQHTDHKQPSRVRVPLTLKPR